MKWQNYRKVMTQSHGSNTDLKGNINRIYLFRYNIQPTKNRNDRQTTNAYSMEEKMTTDIKQTIFHFVREQNTSQTCLKLPKETTLSDFIAKAEKGNEMAMIYLAEWYEYLLEQGDKQTHLFKQLNQFFMKH